MGQGDQEGHQHQALRAAPPIPLLSFAPHHLQMTGTWSDESVTIPPGHGDGYEAYAVAEVGYAQVVERHLAVLSGRTIHQRTRR